MMAANRIPHLLVLALLLSIPDAVYAGQAELQIDHKDGRIRTIIDGDLKTSTGVRLVDNPTIPIRKGNAVGVTIINPNPLLFVYNKPKLGTPTPTPDQVQLEKFASLGLGPLAVVLKGAPSPGAPGGLAQPDCFSLPGLKELREKMPAIEDAAEKSTDVIRTSLTNPTASQEDVREWKPDEWKKALDAADKELRAAAKRIISGEDPENCAGNVALALGGIPDAQETVRKLKMIQELTLQIGQPISFANLFTVNIAENQPIEVEITKSAFFPEDLKDESNRPLGKFTITVAPQSRARIATLAPAAIYSFVRDPTFEAKASGSQFVITQSENPYKELDLAAMLQVEPDAWDLGPLNLGFQLGASPQKDPGLFLGFSLRANELFTFGAGVGFQRVTRLKDGLSIGQTLATQDLLKTEKEFKEGLYIHLTVTPKKKN